jgi:hypothetical protein
MLEDLSYVTYYVTSRQVEAGVLTQKKPRILVLVHTVALSDKEAAAIEEFVRNGGVVIADVRCGIADGRCRLREKGALDELFGIARKAGEGRAVKGVMEVGGEWDSAALKVKLAKNAAQYVVVDAEVSAQGGTPLGNCGETPAVIVNAVGKGATVLLNFSLHSYRGTQGPQGTRVLLDLARALLYGTGVRPMWGLLDAAGEPMAGGRVSAFVRGKARILGALPPATEDREKPVKARIVAPRKAHLYDVRSGKYLGMADSVNCDLRFASATVLSALPYRVQGVEVHAPMRCAAGEMCDVGVRIRGEGDTTGAMPVIRINVIGPEGGERHYYARTLYPEGLQASLRVPFALNDPLGEWRIVARDVLTGMTGSAKVRLEEGRR